MKLKTSTTPIRNRPRRQSTTGLKRRHAARVKDLVDELSPATVMILTNSIYFKALWESPFDPQHTFDEVFHRKDGTTVTTPMMRLIDPVPGLSPMTFPYTEMDGFQVLEMPFQDGDASMVFVMPQERDAPNELSPELMGNVHTWLDTPRAPVQVDIFLPKLKMSVSTKLESVLAEMGMPSAFGPADFSAMTDAPVRIEKVRHKAFLGGERARNGGRRRNRSPVLFVFRRGHTGDDAGWSQAD